MRSQDPTGSHQIIEWKNSCCQVSSYGLLAEPLRINRWFIQSPAKYVIRFMVIAQIGISFITQLRNVLERNHTLNCPTFKGWI